ncbi:MAG: hypothetical protein KDD34_08260, partial [Bdellovibrionales bacterium]|nr:hypothetical protein [Bdellovibrionales bacterium]
MVKSKKSIIDLIENLPEQLLRNYTLMQESASLQPATPLYPRTILFGETGQLILTFHGNPQEHSHNTIEVAEFDSRRRRLFYREIIELQKGIALNSHKKISDFLDENMLEVGDIDILNDRFLLTKPNPNKCMACHAMKPENFPFSSPHSKRLARYIWSPYKEWADDKIGSKAYGFMDDNLLTQNEYLREGLAKKGPVRTGHMSDLLADISELLPDLNQMFPKVQNPEDAYYVDKHGFQRNERQPQPGFYESFLPFYREFENYIHFRQLAETHTRYKYLKYNGHEYIG